MRYEAWGETRYAWGDTPTSYRYTGQREDGIIGLYFYNARYYDAALGRFVQADTIVPSPGNPQSFNRYSYVLNNPVLYTDPSGHRECGPACESDWTNDWSLDPCIGSACFGAWGSEWGSWNRDWGGTLSNGLRYVKGAFQQFVDDMTAGTPTNIMGGGWKDNPNEAFQEGRRAGRALAESAALMLEVDGAKNAIGGSAALEATAGVTVVCAVTTEGTCVVVTGPAMVVEGAVVLVGAAEMAYGGAVLHHISSNPLGGGGRSREWRPLTGVDLPSSYKPPKGGRRRVTVQHGRYTGRKGWLDKNGDIWVPSKPGESHGGPHWDVQINGGRGGHYNVYPDF